MRRLTLTPPALKWLVSRGDKRPLRIAVTEAIAVYRLPALLAALRVLAPSVQPVVEVVARPEVVSRVERGLADLGVCSTLRSQSFAPGRKGDEGIGPSGVRTAIVGAEPICLVSTEAATAAKRARVLVTAPGCVYRELAERDRDRAKGVRWDLLQLGSLESVRAGVLNGLGVGLLPRVAVSSPLRSGHLVELTRTSHDDVAVEARWSVHSGCPKSVAQWLAAGAPSLPAVLGESRRPGALPRRGAVLRVVPLPFPVLGDPLTIAADGGRAPPTATPSRVVEVNQVARLTRTHTQ